MPVGALPDIELSLRSDRNAYAVGDAPAYYARSSADCHLTLINVDPDRSAVVLFPNGFEQDNRLQAGRELKLPKADAPYRLRLVKAGRERLIGICSEASQPPPGIVHDFERMRFTLLGDWDRFQASVANGRMDELADARGRRAGENGRRGHDGRLRQLLPDRQGRAEITYEVR
ncbi:MAG TPA: DUF4384 domain-containing protein [Hyphomicrobiaceae bacterium]|nr:DUF4384 domain-containing protein [Hyphomicrobiaceae bacterium]